MKRRGLLVGLALLAVALGCGDGARPGAAGWIRQAREVNEHADAALARGDVQAARAALESLLNDPAPASVAARDRRVVLQDAAFRLAELALSAQEPKRAREWVERGLALGRSDDLFTANLLVAGGRARESLGDDHGAIEDYREALRINEALLEDALRAKEGSPKP